MASLDYEVLELVGRGSFGQIRKVRRKSDDLILVRKEISYHRMSTKEKEQLAAEFRILAQLKHPNIVQYYHREHIKSDSMLHLYMEYCGNGDLSKIINRCKRESTRVSEEVVWSIFLQLVLALHRCHTGGDPPELGDGTTQPRPARPSGDRIMHRDLKPENVFLGIENDVKLGDFGLSKALSPEQHLTTTYVGTPYYMSPEIVSDQAYTFKSDIWSLGCIIYELCQLSPPFNAKTQWSLIDKIKIGQYPQLPSIYSLELRKTIDLCLKVDARQRPDTVELLNREEFKMARRQRELVLMRRSLKAREDDLARKELSLQQEFKEAFEKQTALIREELDAKLQKEWEIKAELEISKEIAQRENALRVQYQAEFDAHVQYELERRIRVLDLVPRPARDISPVDNFNSSGSSSGSSHPSSPKTNLLLECPVLAPDSPADITMASPSAFVSPLRKSLYTQEPPKMLLHEPWREGNIRTISEQQQHVFPIAAECSLARLSGRTLTSETDAEVLEPVYIEGERPTKRITTFSNGSPVRLRSIRPTGRQGLQRARTTGLLLANAERRDRYGMGGRGNSMDDVATIRENALRGAVSAVQISRLGRGRQDMGSPAQWDPAELDAPSPYRKSELY